MNIFPNDARTCVRSITGVGSYDCEVDDSEVFTILSVTSQQSGLSSDTTVLCGSDVVSRNYSQDLNQYYINYLCSSNIQINKTGAGDSSTTTVVYVPYDLRVHGGQMDSFYLLWSMSIFLAVFFGVIFYYRTRIKEL